MGQPGGPALWPTAVRSNALQDGLYARQVLLPGENEDDFKALRRDFFDQHQPVGRAERSEEHTSELQSR